MNGHNRSTLRFRLVRLATLSLVFGAVGALISSGPVKGSPPLASGNFTLAAPQGFGDRQNSWAWSMQWWEGHLYVGTNRAYHCAEVAALSHISSLLFPYPPPDADIACTLNPEDLPLQAEIWRWTPETNVWERVYQSPNDVPIPGHPGKFVARDIGYRGMAIFTEPGGTEALYVGGVSAGFVWYGVPPPRLLRSTDGLHFAPLPQDPGTVLGDFTGDSFRGLTSYKGRLYVIGGGIPGSGVLLEAEDPAGGNNNFRVVSPPNQLVSAVAPYNGLLYLGMSDATNGYSVIKTDAAGTPPYTYTTVVERGGYLSPRPNMEILSMTVFNNRLYAGGNGVTLAEVGLVGPAELIRINSDDTWDVVVGSARWTPVGYKTPLSGFDEGFNNPFNAHMWRMKVFDGNLYVGTFDASTTFKDNPVVGPIASPYMGFDLYRTPNGTDFYPITTTGFGDKFNFGVRSLEATPYGLFLGTANFYYGLQIWRAQPNSLIYLPLVIRK